MTLLQLMHGMNYGVDGDRGDHVPHGFHSNFRDWSGEISSFPRDVAEMTLTHVIENKVKAAYRRGDLFDKRRKMMQEWTEPSTAIDTMLRGVDLLALTVTDVTNHEGQIRDEFMVRQKKTGKGTLVSLTSYTQKVLAHWIDVSHKLPWSLLFTRLRGDPNQLSDVDLSQRRPAPGA